MSNLRYTADVSLKSKTSEQEDKFIFEQAEKKLKELLASSDLVVARSTTLITLIIGLLVGLISFSVNRYNTTSCFDAFIVMSAIGVCYLFLIVVYISKNLKGVNHSSIGASPEILFHKDFFEATQDEKVRTKMFIWSQIENYQDSIYINKPINEKKWKRFNLSMRLIIASPFILLSSFGVVRYLWF